MDFVETYLKRLDVDSELRKPTHALLCFSTPDTGKKLVQLAYQIAMTRSEGSSIALLYFIDELEKQLSEEELSRIRSNMSSDFMPKTEKEKITLRTFISREKDHTTYAEKVAEELSCDLVMRGIDYRELSLSQMEHYSTLRRDPTNTLQTIFTLFPDEQGRILQEIVTMMGNNKTTTALFIDNGMKEANHIFVPLLCNKDIHVLTYLSHLAQLPHIEIMIWDAIGITDTEPKLQKLYQSIAKRSDGKVQLWNNDRKIEETFIQKQDLIMIGSEGWNRLTNTPLPWKAHLPSLLIIKDIEKEV